MLRQSRLCSEVAIRDFIPLDLQEGIERKIDDSERWNCSCDGHLMVMGWGGWGHFSVLSGLTIWNVRRYSGNACEDRNRAINRENINLSVPPAKNKTKQINMCLGLQGSMKSTVYIFSSMLIKVTRIFISTEI